MGRVQKSELDELQRHGEAGERKHGGLGIAAPQTVTRNEVGKQCGDSACWWLEPTAPLCRLGQTNVVFIRCPQISISWGRISIFWEQIQIYW